MIFIGDVRRHLEGVVYWFTGGLGSSILGLEQKGGELREVAIYGSDRRFGEFAAAADVFAPDGTRPIYPSRRCIWICWAMDSKCARSG